MPRKTRKQSRPKHYTLYVMRHGSTCANLARSLGNQLESDLYTDPELTTEGRRLTRALRPYALKAIPKPMVVGASRLLRTQQTAQLALNPKRIYIIPYLSEMGRWSQESTALAPDLQKTVLTGLGDKKVVGLRDDTFVKETPEVAEANQQSSLLKWLGTHMPTLTNQGRKSLVLVSHYGVLHALIKSVTGFDVEMIRNCELVAFDVEIRGSVAVLTGVKQVAYAPDRLLDWDLGAQTKEHGCRLTVGKTRK